MTPRDPNLISLGRRPRPTGRAVPLTPATRFEIDRFEDSLRIDAGLKVACPPVVWEAKP